MHYPGFIGPSNTLASPTADVEETINWYLESTSPGTGKSPFYLRPTPGLDPLIVTTRGPVTNLFVQDGRGFVIGGSSFQEFFASGSTTLYGPLNAGGRTPTISTNGSAGNQLFITSGGSGYTFNLATNTLAIIVDGDFLTPSAGGAFFDGYFINLLENSRTFQISALEDGTSWDPLDVFEISTASDNIQAMTVAHRELWLLGSQTSQVWADVGDPDIPLQPVPGSLMQMGIWAPDSLLVLDNTLFWLATSSRGNNIVVKASGYNPQRISTNAIETFLRQQPRTDDAFAWTYEQDGHTFYVLSSDSWAESPGELATSLCYDVLTEQWHKRALWDTTFMKWRPHLGRCATFGFNRILVGDRQSPAIYTLDPTIFTDGQVVVIS